MEAKKTVRKVIQVGDSFAVTVPKEFVEAHRLHYGDDVEVLYNDVLYIEPIKPEDLQKRIKKPG